nr:hypothetical protein [Tanacetum cinerariifolium]
MSLSYALFYRNFHAIQSCILHCKTNGVGHASTRLILPYGMLLTRLFNHVTLIHPELSSDRYAMYDCVMYPLAAQHERNTRKNYGTERGHHSTSASSSTFYHPSSSHHVDDDNDEDVEGTSRVSTPSPTHFVNSLSNDVPQVFTTPPHDEQNLQTIISRQTKILNCQVQLRDEHRSGLRFDKNVSFEEEVVHQRLRKTLTHVLELSSCVYLDDRV